MILFLLLTYEGLLFRFRLSAYLAQQYLHDELPYHLNVTADSWETKRDGSAIIRQTVWVDQDRYRRILLGHKGQTLKTIGEGARHTLSRVLGHPVHLFLTVMVDPEWTQRLRLTPEGTAI